MLKLGLKSKFGMALASTALGAALIGGGTFALFTSEATNAGNTFTAGTLTIADVTGGAAFATSVNLANLAPGDHDSKTLTIENTGSLDAWVKIDSVTKTGDLFGGATPVDITYDQGAVLVPAHTSKAFNVGYSFPLEADNSYQGDTGSVTFNVKAVQARNNTNDAGTAPNAWE